MPSLQSYIFRPLIRRIMSEQFDARKSVAEIRAYVAKNGRPLTLARGTKIQAATVANLPAYWIDAPGVNPEHVILYLHGGGFIMGFSPFDETMLSRLSRDAGARILALDYRLAPEHPFPAPVDDTVAAYQWLLQQGVPPQNIVIGGDSSGGNLALSGMIMTRDSGDPLPAGIFCFSPGTDMTLSGPSFESRAKRDPVLSLPFLEYARPFYTGDADLRAPLLSPIFADLHGLPPMMIHVGDDEILLSDAEELATKARASGVAVDLVVWPHMWHVFEIFAPFLPEARRAVAATGAFVKRQLTASRTIPGV